MIKHIVGFIIFTFVIGTSALIAALFNPVQKTVGSVKISRGYDHYSSRKRCKKKRRPKRPRVYINGADASLTQAVFYPGNGMLLTSRAVDRSESMTRKTVALHFYFLEESGARHVMSRPTPIPNKTGVFDRLVSRTR